jgi:hypothetical protein
MDIDKLIRIAKEYEDTLTDVPLATLRQKDLPFTPRKTRPEPQIAVVDADGLTDQDYIQTDAIREQTLARLKEIQRLTSKALQLTAAGQGSWQVLPYIVQLQRVARSAEENCKVMEDATTKSWVDE